MRYTLNQRKVETKARLYEKKRLQLKQQYGIDEVERRLPSSKSMDAGQFTRYLQGVWRVEWRLEHFYGDPVHRRWRLNVYINKRRSEDRFINRLRAMYGDDIVIVIGDWNNAGRTRKHLPSTVTVGWRKVFERNGIQWFLIDEFRTSSVCPACGELINKERKHYRPYSKTYKQRRGQEECVHGLLFCDNVQCIRDGWRYRYWNRDELATQNMVDIIRSYRNGNGRPVAFQRL